MYQYGIILGLIIGTVHPVSDNQIIGVFLVCTLLAYPCGFKWWDYLLGICLGFIILKLISHTM